MSPSQKIYKDKVSFIGRYGSLLIPFLFLVICSNVHAAPSHPSTATTSASTSTSTSTSTPTFGISQKYLDFFRGGALLNATNVDDIEEEEEGMGIGKRIEIVNQFDFIQINGQPLRRPPVLPNITPKAIEGMDVPDMPMRTTNIAETNLPTDIGHFRLRAYRIDEDVRALQRNRYVGAEPCVIYSPKFPPFGKSGVPVRIHDQCFTSEVFRSQRCDCKEQLNMALKHIDQHGGALIYLQQEGRGIGIANKVAAYSMQDVGYDTVDANTHLGFPDDCRQYGMVPSILEDMGIDSIKLMTNNPRKIVRLTALGVTVDGTVPVVVPKATEFNRKYLQTKQDRMNHRNFGDMLMASSSSSMARETNAIEKVDHAVNNFSTQT